jgi:hypothetical protein
VFRSSGFCRHLRVNITIKAVGPILKSSTKQHYVRKGLPKGKTMHLVGMILLNLSTLLFLVSGASAVIRFEPPPSNASVLEGGTATFTCVPKEDRSSPIALWNIHLVRNINETIFVGPGNTTNLTGSSGVILSPNRTQLRITGIQRRLDGIGVECRGSSNSGLFPAPLVYISVQSTHACPQNMVFSFNVCL